MLGLEKLADEFDKMYAESQRTVDNLLLERAGRWAGETFGPDSVGTYAFAFFPVAVWTLYTFAAGAGKGLVDVFRLGEGVRSGTLSGVGADALRLLNVLPVVGMGAKAVGTVSRLGAVARATEAAGGAYAMSCGPQSATLALRLSGARTLVTLDEFGQMIGKGSPKAANYPGVYIDEILPALRVAGATAQEIRSPGQSLQAVEAAAAQGRGPVIFGVQWWGSAPGASPGLTQPLRAGLVNWTDADHFMVAFRNARGSVLVADQFGVRSIAEVGRIQGTVSQFGLTSRAILVQNVGFVKAVERMRVMGETLTGTRNTTARSWLALSLGLEMVSVSPPVAAAWDDIVREAVGRPPRTEEQSSAFGNAAGKPGAGSAGSTQNGTARSETLAPNTVPANAGAPNIPERVLIRSVLGPAGARTPADDVYSRLIAAGYSSGRVTAVLEEMEKNGEVELIRGKSGTVASGWIVRRR